MKHVLIVGGSNAKGRGTGGFMMNQASPLIEVWNNQSENPSPGNAWISSPAAGNAPWDLGGGNNSGLWFADRMAKELKTSVRLVVAAKGSLLMSEAQPPSGPRYTLVTDAYLASGAEPADVLIWNNGDGALGTDYQVYKAQFLNMIAGLTSLGVLSTNAAIIIQELCGTQAYLNDETAVLVSEVKRAYLASGAGLSSYDNLHYDGPSLYHMGYHRCWQAYQQFTGPKVFFGSAFRSVA